MREDECSGPAPSSPWGRRRTIPLCRSHFAEVGVSTMETKRWKAITLGRRDEGVYDDLRSVEEVAELDGDVSTAEAPLRASDVPAPPI